jgi:23S rRNA pseudouridine2605 synthase
LQLINYCCKTAITMQKKSSGNFNKFAKKKSNAAIKEQFKQEKRKWKKEREEFFDKKRADKAGEFRQQGNDPHKSKQQVNQPASHAKPEVSGSMPLNKFIAHAGICGRREAAELVKEGKVKVNNELVMEPGHKVSSKDEIRVNGKKVFLSKNLVYILLNKPKDYITTTDDPQKRKTVLDLIARATGERVYPVGRLDRNTSGVLLLTNDGELAQKLTHPSNEVKKVYAVTLDKPLEKKDFDQILKGVVLEDGPASVDVLAYPDIKDKTQVGVEIHSGRNRIVRRIFESLGYDVKNLDRVVFAGLTKKNIERGKWRFLSEKEVRDLKHFGKGKR